MRISNNQKGMVTTHILGLFLTVATPLSLSLISTSSVIAADDVKLVDLNQSVMFDKQPLSFQLKLVEKHFESEPKVSTIILSEEGKISTYNLGHALHSLKTTFAKKGNSVFLNELLQHFRSENPELSQEIAADMTATMIYQCFRFAVELVANRTAGQSLEAIKLNLDVVDGMSDVAIKSIAYQNVLKKILVNQYAEVEQKIREYKVQSAKWDEESTKEESRLESAHKEEIAQFERKKTRTNKSIEELDKAFKEKEKPTSSDVQDYQENKKIYEGTIQGFSRDIEVAQSQFAKAKKERAEALSQKKKEYDLAIEQLKEKHNLVKQAFVNDFSFIFEDLGSSVGWKTISRVWYGKPTNREGYDYALLDKELLASPELLKDAKSLLLSKVSSVSQNTKSAILEFSESDILEALLARLNATRNTAISISKDTSLDANVATSGTVESPQQPVLVTPSVVIAETIQKPKGTILGAPTPTLVLTDGGLQQQIVQHTIQQLGLNTDAQVDVTDTVSTPIISGDAAVAQSSNATVDKVGATTKQPIKYKKKQDTKKKKK